MGFVWTELDQNPFFVTIHILRGHFKDKNLYFCYWIITVGKIMYIQILYPLAFWVEDHVGVPYYTAINSLYQPLPSG